MLVFLLTCAFCLLIGYLFGGWHKKRTLDKEQGSLLTAFRSLSFEALAQNNQCFLDLAKSNLEKFQQGAQDDLTKRQEEIHRLVHPVKESLEKFDHKILLLEKTGIEAQAGLKQQVSLLMEMQRLLQQETTKIASSLRSTTVRGRWGEIQLRRIVELAGLTKHCDFFEQPHGSVEEQLRRPDMLVRLPAGKQIIIDAKAPLDAYLLANETEDDQERALLMKKHALAIREHIRRLASKSYTQAFQPTPEFVVLFLPAETFFSAALSVDPSLIEVGAEEGVILATPTTLIALLRSVFYGWKQEAISENAQKISQLGRELYQRLTTVGGHWAKMGKNLESAVHSYNEAVGSMERRLFPKAREFEKLHPISDKDTLEVLSPIAQMTRQLQIEELIIPDQE
ncbi:MAG: DNA recombination protein RmuC [Verrucomicrobia bacterium]|nr:DNA recombination protein RmuC [Verrucomicrobiota bacterium]